MRCRYNAVIYHLNPHKRHPISRPHERAIHTHIKEILIVLRQMYATSHQAKYILISSKTNPEWILSITCQSSDTMPAVCPSIWLAMPPTSVCVSINKYWLYILLSFTLISPVISMVTFLFGWTLQSVLCHILYQSNFNFPFKTVIHVNIFPHI